VGEAAVRRVFLALFFLSGFAALLYQVLWFRLLSLILGGSIVTTSTVLAAFMAGLALGARLASSAAPRLRNPLRTYAWLELLVGLTALASPLLLAGVRGLFVALAPDPVEGTAAGLPLLRGLLAFLVLLVPTTAMGATLPVLVSRFVRRWEESGVRVGSLYAANLWGAVSGVFLAGFFLLPLLGARTSLVIGAAVNFAIALAALHLARRVPASPPAEPAPAGPGPSGAAVRGLLALFLITGACSFVYEVLWTRLLVLHLGSSAYAFSLMLTLFLLGLALGGATGGWAADRVRHPAFLLGAVELGVAALTLLSLLYLRLLPEALETAANFIAPEGLGFAALSLASALAAAPLLLPATFLIGASFPIGAKILIRDPRTSGEAVGRLYSWNTIGNIVGALAGGFLLLPLLGAQGGMLWTAGLNALTGAVLLLLAAPGRASRLAAAPLGLVLFASLAWPVSQGNAVLTAGIFAAGNDREILYLEETPQGTVTLTRIREEAGVWKSLDVDGVNVAGTSPGLVAIQKLQGHLPLLLHPAPKAVLHIGFGSGGTARAVSTHPEVERIDIVEINPAVLRMAARHLPEVNEGVLEDPRVRVIIDDGRNFLLATGRTYDVILSDAVHPRYAGNSALYTTDYFREARRRLRPGGLMSMWLPIYGLSPESFKMILASMRAVFPDTSLWYVNSTINEFCIVVGRTGGPGIDVERMTRALAQPTVREDLLPVAAAEPLQVLDYLVAQGKDLDVVLEGTPLSRDDRPLVEYLSARSLDRTLTWMQNFAILRQVRTPRWDLLADAAPDAAARQTLRALYSSTTWNLEGQAMLLLAGHHQVAGPEQERARKAAEEAFRQAAIFAPDEREPWEWYGVPPAYPGEWNR